MAMGVVQPPCGDHAHRNGAVIATLIGCAGTGLAGIGQLADVAGRWTPDHGVWRSA